MKVQRKGTNSAISARLALHAKLTAQLIAEGWGNTSASQVAYAFIIKRPNQPKREHDAASAALAKL